MTFPLVILCFHRILPESFREGADKPYFLRQTALSLERFCELLDNVQRFATILPPEALLDWPRGVDVTHGPGVVLTFDDGYADMMTFAVPELKRRGLRAIVCITTATLSEDYVFPVDRWYATINAAVVRRGTLSGFGDEPWSFDLDEERDVARLVDGPEKRAFVRANEVVQEELLGRLERALGVATPHSTPDVLSTGDLKTLLDAGFLLGAHGHYHMHLSSLSEENARDELARSYAFFQAQGLPAPSVTAYPDGATSEQTEKLAKELGFSVGLALGSRGVMRNDSAMHLPRFIPTNDPTWFERRLAPIFRAAKR
jgi:peptidoglycan/xylan/chitin deacetylase (PgdA/CDA1 family)